MCDTKFSTYWYFMTFGGMPASFFTKIICSFLSAFDVIYLVTVYNLSVLPALVEFALLIFEHGPEVQAAIKVTLSELLCNISSVD